MSHPEEGVLQELLDGELAPANEAVIRAHLTTCAACTALLEELRTTQVEATSIVSRLELEPPLRRAVSRRTGGRRVNLRLLGLAASVMLVAGTSWLLFRAPAGTYRALAGADSETAALAVPREEPDQPATIAPAPTAAPARTADQATTGEKKAKSDAAPAAAEDAFRERLKREVTAPAAPAAAPTAAATNTSAASLTIAEAESRLGWKVRTIEGLSPQSVELMEGGPDVDSGVRQRYLIAGVPVVLVQQAVARTGESQVSVRGGRADELTSKQRAVTADQSMKALQAKDSPEGGVAGAAAAPSPNVRSWDSAGVHYQLEGALPADSLDALVRRVR